MAKVAINGFGRIGRLVARAMLSQGDTSLDLVAINDLGDARSNAFLFKRDSVHGTWAGDVSAEGDDLVIDGKRIRVTAERDPANLPHKELGVDLVLEALIVLARDQRVPACGIVLEINGGNKHYATKAYMERVEALRREIERLGVGPIRILDRGAYGRDELAGRMAAVDWVLVPSTWRSSGWWCRKPGCSAAR